MTHGGDVLKRFRRARGLTQIGLEAATVAAGRRVSKSQIAKVERGERTLSDEVFEALADALALSDAERSQVEQARAGTGGVDVVTELLRIEARLASELAEVRGQVRASANLVMDAVERLRASLNR